MVPDLYSLTGKTVLVTGASSGLGYAAVQLIVACGGKVVATGRNAERLEQLRSEVDHPEMIAAVTCDVTKAEELAALVEGLDPIDGVVMSAGIQKLAPLKLLDAASLDELLDTNLRAPILLTHLLLRRAKLKPASSLVLLSSIAAHTGTEGNAAYAATKGGLEAFVRPAALELAKRKIRINAVAPAMVVTPIYKDHDDTWFEQYRTRYPLGLGAPEDVAATIVFLLGKASSYVTGTTVVMDGGTTRV